MKLWENLVGFFRRTKEPAQKIFGPNWQSISGGGSNATWDAFRSQKEPSKVDLIRSYNDLVFNCIRLITSKISTIPLRLYVAESYSGQKSYAPVSKKNLLRLSKHLPHFGGAVSELRKHPLLKLINRANSYHNYPELISLLVTDLDLTGNAFLLMEFNQLGEPCELYPLPSAQMYPERDDNAIVGWRYGVGRNSRIYKPKDLVHIKYVNPADPYGEGKSPTGAAWGRIEVSLKEVSMLDVMLGNQGRPDSIISLKDSINPFETERLQKEFSQRYRGGGNGGPLILDGTMNYQALQFPPKDLGDLAIHQVVKTCLCNAYGIPPDVLELGTSSNRSTRDAALYALAADCIAPRINLVTEKLNERLVPYFDDRLFFSPDECVPEDVAFNLQEFQMLLSQGVITREEARKHYGFEDEAWANEPLLPSGMTLANAPPLQAQGPDEPEPEPITPEQAPAAATNDLRATVGGSTAILALQAAFYTGQLPRDACIGNAVLIFGFTSEEAGQLFPLKPPGATPPATPPGIKCGGEGGSPGPCPTATPDVHAARQAKVSAVYAEAIDKTNGLSDQQKAEYKASIDKVTKAMPPEALKRLASNVKRVRFHAGVNALTAKIASENQNVASKLAAAKEQGKPFAVAGTYDSKRQQLDLDGKARFEGQDVDTSHFHAHEMGHAIDGPAHEISNSPEWKQAWNDELKGGALSKYGGTSPAEGFAEFGRLGYAAQDKQLATKFPKCAAVWKSRGLI